MAICEGPIVGIKQIWAGGNLIYADDQPVLVTNYQGGGKKQGPSTSTTYQTFGSSTVNGVQTGGSALGPWTCYLGQPGQPADPTIGEGVGYEGIAYIVFNPMNLGPSGTVPPLTFEVVTQGTLNPPALLWRFNADSFSGFSIDDDGNILTQTEPFEFIGSVPGPVVGLYTYDSAGSASLATYPIQAYGLGLYKINATTGQLGQVFIRYPGGLWEQDWGTEFSYAYYAITPSSLGYVAGSYLFPPKDTSRYYGCLSIISADSGAQTPILENFPNAAQSVSDGQNAWFSSFTGAIVGIITSEGGQAFNAPSLYTATQKAALNGYAYWAVNGALIIIDTKGNSRTVSSYSFVGVCVFGDAVYVCYKNGASCSIATITPSGVLTPILNIAWPAGNFVINNGHYWIMGGSIGVFDMSGAQVATFQLASDFDLNLQLVSNGSNVYGYSLANIYCWDSGYNTIIAGTMDLPAAVTILCDRAGIESFDVSLLPDVPVNFVRQDTTNARSMLGYLSKAYFFSMVDSGGTLRFVPYGLPPAASIPLSDLGYGKVTPNAQTPYTASRVTGTDLPRSVKIRYTSPAQLWNAYEQIFALESYDSGKEVTLSLPLILDDTSAYNIASIACTLPHAERMQYSFTTSLKWLALEPGDVVSLPFGVCRILSVKMGTGSHDGLTVPVLEFTACIDGMNALAGAGYAVPALPNYTPGQTLAEAIFNPPPLSGSGVQTTGSAAPHPIATAPPIPQKVPNAGVAKLAITEPPPLSQSDTGMRFLVGAYSTGNVFPGAGIFQSTDGGTTYAQIDTTMAAETTGYANTALPAPTGPYNQNNSYTWDNFSTVDIYGLSPGFDLSSLPDINVLNGGNLAMLGSELIQFAEATLNTDSLGNPYYTLSRLLRGRRGTEWAMGSHQLGEKFYLIPGAMQDQTYTAPMLNNPALYKVAMMGSDLGQLLATSYEPSGASLMQWAPCDVRTSKDSAGDWTISWTPRARYNGDFASGFTPYLDPDTIGWSIDILNNGSVVRTIAVPLAQTAPWETVYTAAMQSDDGFSAGETGISFNLYQLSQSIGRGYPASGSTGAAPSEI